MEPPLAPLLLCSLLLFLAHPPPASSAARHGNYHNATAYTVSASAGALEQGLGAWAEALEFLYYHNAVRMARWEPPLVWSPRLEAYARWWASQRRADGCALRHSFPDGQFALGENIFWGSSSSWRPGDAVKEWAAEGVDYSYAANACAPGRECAHYTQLVWRRTALLGCARVVCGDHGEGVFMTCNYYPPGNVVGERPY